MNIKITILFLMSFVLSTFGLTTKEVIDCFRGKDGGLYIPTEFKVNRKTYSNGCWRVWGDLDSNNRATRERLQFSTDGENWETVKVISWAAFDVSCGVCDESRKSRTHKLKEHREDKELTRIVKWAFKNSSKCKTANFFLQTN